MARKPRGKRIDVERGDFVCWGENIITFWNRGQLRIGPLPEREKQH